MAMVRITTIAGAAVVAAGLAAAAVQTQAQGQLSALRTGEVRQGAEAVRVDDYLTRLVPHGFSGAVLIASVPRGGNWATEGKVVLKKAYGLANRETGLPYTVDMVSCIGSVTKQFTGAAIMKLEMAGKLNTADPISKYLPGVPEDKAGITIHHLLTHTAGFSGDLGGMDEEPIERDALVARVLASPLVAKPGERFEYSNEGFALAGAIVERVSGQGYEAFLREHLFLPADMADTGYQAPAWPLTRLPMGYRADGQAWGRTYKNGWLPDGPGWYLRANGGIHATLDDLYRWHLALESSKVLSADARTKYLTGHTPAGGGERYAYGWGVQTSRRGGTVITHNGGNGFFFTDFRRYVDEGVVIIAMSNQPVIPATQLAPRQLEALYFNDAPVVMPPAAVEVPKAQRAALAGTYTTEAGARFVVRATETALDVEADDPALFGAVGALTPAGGRFADFEKRTLPLIEAAAKGDFRPIYEAFKFEDGRPFTTVEANQSRFWREWRTQFGEYQRVELLGTAIVQGDPAVTIRLRFERGGPVLQYIWGPRRLAGFRAVPTAPVALTAESAAEWVFYSYRQPQLTRVRFGEGGTLVVAGVTAKRVSPKASSVPGRSTRPSAR
ncbi:MAG: class A beta-lactamase-related serine hydrolase [Acidobacteria bacterium]|nr:class A beta-lactamase-related serine hydrolase [Acidobacteriota bacterium]